MWENTLFTPSSPVKATKLYRFCLSDKRSQNLQSILSDEILLKSLLPFSDEWSPNGIACLAIVIKAREPLAIVHRQVTSILSNEILLKSLLFFSNKWSPKGIACLAIGCCKIASKDLAIRHSQNHKRLYSDCWSPNRHCLSSDKRAQNCRIYLAIISSRSPVIISNIRMPNG
jgi:hypothetical protein